jgi:Co/Zn/Cd efflux system component
MSSLWECSRNDIAGNIAVFVAAFGVWAGNSQWPDIAVAVGLLALLLRSSWKVIATARAELRASSG